MIILSNALGHNRLLLHLLLLPQLLHVPAIKPLVLLHVSGDCHSFDHYCHGLRQRVDG